MNCSINNIASRNKGFTLVEVLVATILVGMAIASLMAANASLTRTNGAGIDISTAEFLLDQIRELSYTLAVTDPETGTNVFGPEEGSLSDYDDIDDFDGKTFSPPIDADFQQLDMFSSFSQNITVSNVNSSNFNQVVSDHSSPFVKITVTITQNGKQIVSQSWIRAAE